MDEMTISPKTKDIERRFAKIRSERKARLEAIRAMKLRTRSKHFKNEFMLVCEALDCMTFPGLNEIQIGQEYVKQAKRLMAKYQVEYKTNTVFVRGVGG